MDNQTPNLMKKVGNQFDTSPYPRISLEQSPKDHSELLYIHNFTTSYYLREQKVIDTQGKVILDAGCGSGYKTLVLAEANPGAKLIGIDISAESVKLARQRLEYHGFYNVDFYVISIENSPNLGIQFDYINNDEVLYLLPDPIAGLRAMKAILKPDGIIRTNIHSSLQRSHYFQTQKLFKMMGLSDSPPGEPEIELVRGTMKALKDDVFLKATTWKSGFEKNNEGILMNYLLQGDKGYTIPELFSALKAADLEFINMVHWRQWDLLNLFENLDELPIAIAMGLAEMPVEQRLHVFELLQPIHRLLDLWCGHPQQTKPVVPVTEWTTLDWQGAQVHLHPQLRTPKLREDLVASVTELRMFEIDFHLPIHQEPVSLDSSIAACLLPLLEGPQSMRSLVKRWQKLRPVHPVTLEPTDEGEALAIMQQLLTRMESLGYVLLRRC